MNRLSPAVKAIIAFVVLVLLLAAGYAYENSRTVGSPQDTDVAWTQVSTSTEPVLDKMNADHLVFLTDAKVVDTRIFNVSETADSKTMYALVYTTGSTKDRIAGLYTSFLPSQGYTLGKMKAEGDRTEILASKGAVNLTVDIKPLHGTETVTLLLEEPK